MVRIPANALSVLIRAIVAPVLLDEEAGAIRLTPEMENPVCSVLSIHMGGVICPMEPANEYSQCELRPFLQL